MWCVTLIFVEVPKAYLFFTIFGFYGPAHWLTATWEFLV